jgi:phosphoglycolate phosphatase-like HAD superfamily hydrolase
VLRERWLVPRRRLERWAKSAELALFTGRTRRELKFTLDRFGVADLFKRSVTMDDVDRLKPDPEGLHFLLGDKHPREALYLGDNLDDALASRGARVPFVGILPRGSEARRTRGGQLRSHGAKLLLDNANELDRYLK